MSETSGQLHFSYDAAFIMHLARTGYWFENRKEWALDLLACVEGMTTEQTMKVLRGEAYLKGTDQALYYDEPDTKFKAKLKKHLKWLADEDIKKKKEIKRQIEEHAQLVEVVENTTNEINGMTQRLRKLGGGREALLQNARDLHDEVMSGRPEKPKELVAPKVPAKVGDFVVEKELLESYIAVAVEHDLHEPWSAGTALLLSGRMMKIHLQLRESVGLEGYWGRDPDRPSEPDKFDKALQAIVHKEVEKDERYKSKHRLEGSRYDEREERMRQYGKSPAELEAEGRGEPYGSEDEHPGD